MRLRRFYRASGLAGLAAGLLSGLGLGATDTPAPAFTPYQHRAWYIYLIAQYTEWPADAFAEKTAPFVLGILGEDPFGKDLDLIRDKTVRNRPLTVRHFKRVEEIKTCHALYIAASEQAELPAILAALGHRPILTFGEQKEFRPRGGIVKLWMRKETSDKGYLYFDVNQAAAARVRLRISSYVLKLARPEPSTPSTP